ncbi:SDR family oxidoreductase [Myxococcus faecalis]|jgi:1-acyl-sn-glycerol-3-phosphate acyltransferase|uniref:SDR family oxidoreductase n=1 Tax=Myxococcus faecalis TaxID=3115646 RepID=UPI003CF2EA0C
MSRHVFLTGVTGFVGKVVLEALLHQGVERVTVLVRESKDRQGRVQSAAERFAKVAQAACFSRLPAGWTQQVDVVSGDLEQPACGLSAADRDAVRGGVTHVVHCAASVEFDLPLAQATSANIRSALSVLELARECPKVVGMVDVSTAYVSVWRPGPVEEKLAHLPKPASELYEAFQVAEGDGREWLTLTGHPNTYTLTKSVAEHLICERRGHVPVVIVRPSIVSAAHRAPFPGWLDSPAALAGCLLYSGLGVVRAFNADPSVRLDVVPVDVVASEVVRAVFGPMPAEGQPVPIVHATMGVQRALRIDMAAAATIEWFKHRPGVVKAPDMFVGRKDHGFDAADLVRRELPVQLQKAALTVLGQSKALRKLVRADQKVQYLNEGFSYFTHHTFDFVRSAPLEVPGFEPREYVRVVNEGMYRHLLSRDESQVSFAGPKHDDGRADSTWLKERPAANTTLKVFGYALRKTFRHCTSDVTFDRPSFERAMAQVPPGALVVLAPTHRSYFDFLLTSYLCFQHPELGISMPHIAAAEEFGRIPVVGPILKDSQAFFIKRGVGREVPELGEELRRLTEKNASLMFFIEGQRSRARLMLPPKRGLLRALQNTGRQFVVLPVAISYDRLPEEASLCEELSGKPRPKMTLTGVMSWLGRLARGQVQLGRVHVACGQPQAMGPDTDVRALSHTVMAELQRHTTVSSFHLRAFLAEHPIPGVDEAWLKDAIERRGGRVIASELPVPSPLTPTLAHSLRNQWQNWFAGDVLARQPGNPALETHLSRYRWCATPLAEMGDARVDAVVKALFEPVVRDYLEATKVSAPCELKAVPVAHRPHLDGVVQALLSLDIVKPSGDDLEWGPNAAQLAQFQQACAWRGEVQS